MKSNRRRKVLAGAVCASALCVALVGGTMAFMADEERDVNVFTSGSVDIVQHEYERVVDENGDPVEGVEGTDFESNYDIAQSYKLQSFTQGKPAVPAVYTNGSTAWDEFQQLWNQVGAPGSNDLFDDTMENVIDKFVFVENTGKSDAYYRTIIAIESPEGLRDGAIHTNFNSNSRFDAITQSDDFTGEADKGTKSYRVGYATIDGVRYALYNMTYNEVLAPGEVSRPSLLQFYLDPAATNEDCALFGETWDVLVVSQAVQAQGFADADTALTAEFGEITTTSHPWVDGDVNIPVAVDTADELEAALAAGNSVYLTEDITDNRTFKVAENANVTIYMNGHTLTSMDGGTGKNYALSVSNGASLTLKGDGKIVASCYGVSVKPGATFTMDSGEITVQGNGTYDYGVVVWNGATFVMNGGKITASADVYASFWDGYDNEEQPTVVINGGDLVKEKEAKDDGEPAYIKTDCTPNVTINGGTFDGAVFSGNASNYITEDSE